MLKIEAPPSAQYLRFRRDIQRPSQAERPTADMYIHATLNFLAHIGKLQPSNPRVT